jgi:23S rRNA (cytosine1962-C5)-methyltransferase
MRARVTDPALLIADDWTDFAVEDSGAGWKLERYGPYRFARPDPQALWTPAQNPERWRSDGRFSPAADENEEMGRWRLERELPEQWPLHWGPLTALARCTPFRHLGLFPEQSPHWRFAMDACSALGGQPEVLNLFGYTGMASLACAAAGARVTHVDASKKAIGYARLNQAASGLEAKPIRWIVDDAFAFVQRELRRGRRYDGVILDPPKYGRGPNGEVWRLEEGLFDLLAACAKLLRRAPEEPASAAGFLIATVYAVRLSHIALAQTAAAALAAAHGVWQSGDMALAHANDARLLPTAIYARWQG